MFYYENSGKRHSYFVPNLRRKAFSSEYDVSCGSSYVDFIKLNFFFHFLFVFLIYSERELNF